MELKKTFVEPKENKDLPAVMTEYRNVIEESSSKSFRETSGAILFAVFRGKVAEGIDFSDNEARCVLAVSNISYFVVHFIYMSTRIFTRMQHKRNNILFIRSAYRIKKWTKYL